MKAPLPPDEAQRLMSLRKYEILDTVPEQSFDDLALLASHICQTPIALVSLVDEKRQWFKSKVGMKAAETSRDIAFCAHTILHKDEVFEVRDAEADPRFVDNPLVTTDPHVRFYAGAPLVAPDGHALGALCVMDRVPRTLTAEQLAALRALSRNVVAQLELQRQSRELANQNADRQWAQILLQQQFARASANKKEADRLLALSEKSRRALLSVLEDEKLVGQNLLKSENRFRALFENAPDGIVIADTKSNYLDANSSMCRMLGYTREEFVGLHASDIVVPAEIQHIEPALSEIKAKSDYHREWQFRRKDGSVFLAEVIAATLPDGNLMGMIRDITERKRAEEALGASEIRYRRLFESAKDGILILNAGTGMVVDVNPFLVKLLGYSHENFLGKKIWELGFFRDIIANQDNFAELQSKEYIRYDDMALKGSDGRRIDVEFVSNVYLVNQQKVIQCNIRDISGRKKAEVDLREAGRFNQSTINALSSHLCTLDETGAILATNRAWQKFAETNPPQPHRAGIGANYLQVCDEVTGAEAEDAARFATGIRAVIRGERTEFAMEYPCHSPTEQRWFVGHVTRFPNGGPVRVVVAHENITEQRKLEAQFRQAQKMEAIGQLAGGIAHDFNNILAVIQIQMEMMKAEGNLSVEQVGLADEIGLSVQRASALTRQVLLFSRKQTLQPRDLDLNESINEMTKMLRRILGEDIELQFKFSMQALCVRADPGMLDQVLMNLAVNARDASPNGGKLVVETSAVEFDESVREMSVNARPGSFVCLSVSDTGTGIPPEILPKIFEPFFTTKGVGKGTGLGLATIFGIVQQHNGWINVYSEVGRGTTFRIYLPRLAKLSPQQTEQPKQAAVRGGNETILLVEDDAFLRASVLKTLLQLGYRVLDAVNGLEALQVWKQHRDEIHLVLTDLVMPGGINGKELGELLLKDNPKLKVIYASGYSAEITDKDFSLKEGVNFLAKPFQTQKLAQAIRENLDARQLQS
jgi:PAS domain S-box-containing protein